VPGRQRPGAVLAWCAAAEDDHVIVIARVHARASVFAVRRRCA
jgi:hypothetical protein